MNVYFPLIEKLAEAMRCELSARTARRLAAYVEQVVAWNRRLGLTGAKSAAGQVEVLVADALVISNPRIVPTESRLLDVGSGAGAPVLPLLLNRDDLAAVLVESKRKRGAFLRTTAEKLDLPGRLQVVEQRLDPLKPYLEELPFDLAMSRATFAPGVWVRMGATLASRTLVFTAREPPPSPPAGCERTETLDYRLPGSGASRRVTVYARI